MWQGLCEKRVVGCLSCASLPLVLHSATRGGFGFLKRQALTFALDHYAQVRPPIALY